MIIAHKLTMACNFTLFENTQGMCFRVSMCVCVCVYLGFCVLVCGDGRDLCVCVCVCLGRETETEKKTILRLLFAKDFGHLKDVPMLAKD
jgi:hypothetical protein